MRGLPVGLVLFSVLAASTAQATGCIANQGNVTFDSTATLTLQIGGTTQCAQYDQYSVAGKLTLNSPTLDVVLINGFAPSAGNSFTILAWGSLSGTFGTLNLPALQHGLTWNTTLLYTSGTISVVQAPSADVPLPTWALALLAFLLLSASVRRLRH
jgi:hypothetical protein